MAWDICRGARVHPEELFASTGHGNVHRERCRGEARIYAEAAEGVATLTLLLPSGATFAYLFAAAAVPGEASQRAESGGGVARRR